MQPPLTGKPNPLNRYKKPDKRKPKNMKLDEREALFLAFYYSAESPTKGKQFDSAVEAGWAPTAAAQKASATIRKYNDGSFRACAKAVGITKPYLAMKLKKIMDGGSDKEIMAGIRLTLANFGEATDQQAAAGNTFNAPVMIIQGATPERLQALRSAAYQPTKKELEQQSNERSAKKLEMLKRGLLPEFNYKADGRPSHVHPEVNLEMETVANNQGNPVPDALQGDTRELPDCP